LVVHFFKSSTYVLNNLTKSFPSIVVVIDDNNSSWICLPIKGIRGCME
jgi:hypothetical protein